MNSKLIVEAWIDATRPSSEGMQTVVSQWLPREAMGVEHCDAFDAGLTDGLETKGFFGSVFDGRYVYFVPQHDEQRRHGRVLRYDTHGPFGDPGSYAAYDAQQTSGLFCAGYYGACFTGTHVYFTPRQDGSHDHSRVLRYDVRGAFKNPASWDAYDVGRPQSSQGAGFDGRYLYWPPGYYDQSSNKNSGEVIRHDTQADLHDPKAWTWYDAAETAGMDNRCYDGAAFDGRYIYFMPLEAQTVLRCDTLGDFADPATWSAHDVRQYGVTQSVGSVFDGQWVYVVPYGKTTITARYDTTGDFHDTASWQVFEPADIDGLHTVGFDGGVFDGRYVYYIPFLNDVGGFDGYLLRYDTTQPFDDLGSWSAIDAGNVNGMRTIGYNGGSFDGRYLYCAPWQGGEGKDGALLGHGRILRYDTLGAGTFALRWCDYGHNGGLCAAVPGPSFAINTDRGPRNATAHRIIDAGKHHLRGEYDGKTISLHIDGECVAQREANGQLIECDLPVITGSIDGTVEKVEVSGAS